MSRFHTTTILLGLTALGASLSLQSPGRYFVLGLLALAYGVLFASGISVLKLNFFVRALCRGDSSSRRVALTFDDGPDPVSTPELLKTLRDHGIQAAFFPIGTKVRKYPEVVKLIDREGHILGNHSYRHAWWTNFLFSGQLDREIQKSQEAIGSVIGKVPAYFRPPMGLTNPHLGGKLKRHGLTLIGWDVRPFDTMISNDKVIKKVLGKVRNGSIILLHETGRNAAGVARLTHDLLTGLKKRQYTIVGLEKLVECKPYQTAAKADLNDQDALWETEIGVEKSLKQSGFRMLLAKKLASSAYVRKALKERVTLEAFKARPSSRFLWGVGFVLFSYILGWPMVGLFSFLAAYFRDPALLIAGPVFYGVSHFVFLFGMYLAGRDCLRYADMMLSWGLRKAVEKALLRRNP